MPRSRFFLALVLAVCALAPAPSSQPALPSAESFVERAARGDTEAVLAAIRSGVDPNTAAPIEGTFQESITALMAAAWRDHTETVTALLDAEADAEATDPQGNTALRWAADGHAPAAARALLAAGAAPSTANREGTTAARWAAYVGATDVLAALLEAGVDVDERDPRGGTLLHSAIQTTGATYGGIETVAFLLSNGADPNARADDGSTALHRAASDTPGAFAVTALLLRAGASPEARDARGRTPSDLASERGGVQLAALYAGDPAMPPLADLYVAIVRGDAGGVREALAAGADPNAGTDGNATFTADFIDDGGPVHLAARVGTPDVLAALADGGADLDAVTASGQPPIKVAAERGDLALVRALLAAGAHPEGTTARPFLGMEPIHWAAVGGHAGTVQALLDAGAEPRYTTNATMGYGYNALGYAIHYGHAEVVRVLLGAGMETDTSGDTPTAPLDLAVERGWPAVAEQLRQRGAQTAAEMGRARAETALAAGGPDAAWDAALLDGDTGMMRGLLTTDVAPPADAIARGLYSLEDDPELIGLLAAAGAEVDRVNLSGNTPLHEAAANGLAGLVAALLDAGADPTRTTADGQTALDLARAWGDDEVIARLGGD